jgi:GT2 family glycosyltransferase
MNSPEKSGKPSVGIVIVNHNLRESLRETIESCKKVNYPNVQIVVVDNESKDGSQEMVRTIFPDVHLIANPVGLGYAKAASQGMEFLAANHDYIFSTTNDVILDPEILNRLVDVAENDPRTGVLGTKIYFFDRPTVLWHAGAKVPAWHGHSYHIGWERQDGPKYDKIRECDYVTGCGFLLRSSVLREIAFFKEDLIFYSEDADLCYRIREHGYKVLYVPSAKMWHKTSTTLAKNRSLQLRYSTRNGLYLIQRHRIGYPIGLLSHLFLVSPFKMLVFTLMLRPKNAIGIWRGIQDWRKKKFGMISE